MTRARASLISLDDTPWYHLVNRCVRRAYLCGMDKESGKDLSHRKEWIEARIRQLGSVFAIDVAAYAVMSNHYHVVVRVDRQRAEGWSTREVLETWSQLFKGPLLVQEYLAGKALSPAQLVAVDTLAAQYRTRLHDISWFMRVLNESIARMAAAIPFTFDEYLELVDATGRVIREDKKGYIPGETPRILERLNIDPEQFIATTARMLQQFSTAIGTPEHLTAHCVTRNIAFRAA